MTTGDDAKNTRTNSMGWLVQTLARRLDEEMAQHLATLDLTLQQFAVMMIVLENDGLTQSDIGAIFTQPAYTVSRALDGLEKRDFVKRHVHPNSRRAHRVHVTDAGRELAPQIFAIVRGVNNKLAKPLDAEERAQLQFLLQKILMS